MEISAAGHIAVLSSPGMGHLIPLVEFSKRLLHRHRIATTFIIPTDGPLSSAETTFLSALPLSIAAVLLPAVDLHDLPADVKIETRISLTMIRSLPSIRNAIKSLHHRRRLSAFVADLFGTDAFAVAAEFGIPRYIFFASTAMALLLFLLTPELEKTVSGEFWEAPEKFRLPGCVPVHGRDLVDPLQDRKNDAYKWFVHLTKNYRLPEGIILNTFKEMEPGAIEALQKKEIGNPTIYPVGPLIRTGSNPNPDSETRQCLKWLDRQPSGSVLYVSFGSGGTLSHDQTIELAVGLEMSEQRFLWVIKCPDSKPSYFNVKNSDDPLAYLPEGFLDRTAGRGLVVPGWVPQEEILARESTGGFLTHCGWNSTLESVVNGVPMIAWPLYAEQRMNAVMLQEDRRVALRSPEKKLGENRNFVVGRLEIAEVVKELMVEGKEIRDRIRKLQVAGAEAIGENGESAKTLEALAEMWKKTKTTTTKE
ncbi:hydroquinone glucosyltransferase-like [Andrographis paniculata]|uniref:hydroquinone glucosyltransferase-like n=1 Tax=Andrographis paniculata TaxID=175694 RepID=UPI0021E70371|nr:hydroquinone glucosyltransferase-like [Andrographis paniculata]